MIVDVDQDMLNPDVSIIGEQMMDSVVKHLIPTCTNPIFTAIVILIAVVKNSLPSYLNKDE